MTMEHTPSPTPGSPDPGPSVPPPDHPGDSDSPDVEREEGPGKKKQNEEPEISYEEDIPSDGNDPQGEAEMRYVPARPELAPVPDHLKN
ncbi:MAG: hypothetical protein V4614_18625 [Pseudomonadota bacterium]